MPDTATTKLTDSERIHRLEEAVAALAADLVGSSMNGRATRRPAIVALIAEKGVEG